MCSTCPTCGQTTEWLNPKLFPTTDADRVIAWVNMAVDSVDEYPFKTKQIVAIIETFVLPEDLEVMTHTGLLQSVRAELQKMPNLTTLVQGKQGRAHIYQRKLR